MRIMKIMSNLQNTELFESLIEKWEIVPCINGVGAFELSFEEELTHETFDTLYEAEKAIDIYVKKQFEELS